MFFDPIEIPNKLLDAQQQGKLVVFAGAGVSMGKPSDLPDFKALACQIAGSHPLSADIGKYKARLDRFLGELSRKRVDVQTLCREIIDNPASSPTEFHGALLDLFTKPEHIRIVTTNFDNHFRRLSQDRGYQLDFYHAPALPRGDRFSGVVHLHGSIEKLEPLVLTDEDFGRAYLTEGWAREFLQRMFAEFTTLFVGYSHSDIPVDYLARGMSGKAMAPRFALTPAGETDQWDSLGVRVIPFNKSRGRNKFKNLHAGVKKWAEFTKLQPIEMAEQVKQIVCASEILRPDKTQSSLLRRCLEQDKSCHFFTNEAKGWRWVEWLRNEGLLTKLFDKMPKELTEPERCVAKWLGAELLAENSDQALLLLEQHHGFIGRMLWFALLGGLYNNENLDWSSPLVRKWVLVLAETCAADSIKQLTLLLSKAAQDSLTTLGMTLLRRLTELRIIVKSEFDFTSPSEGGHTFETKRKAELEIAVAGDVHTLEVAWVDQFRPRLSEIREPLLVMLENRLREADDLYRAAGRGSVTFNPLCIRSRIYDAQAYQTGDGLNLILDWLIDVLEENAKKEWSLPQPRLVEWLTSGVPVLVRVGLHALHLSKTTPEPRKVKLLQELKLVHPAVFGATHEAWRVLTECYSALGKPARQALWQAINQGPAKECPDGWTPEVWEDSRQKQIDTLTWFLGEKSKECPVATHALAALKQRNPSFQGREGMDQAFFVFSGEVSYPEAEELVVVLLRSPIGEKLNSLLSCQQDNTPSAQSREDVLDAVRSACAKSPEWGISLLEGLAARQAWNSDLWNAALMQMNRSALPQEKQAWLLEVFERHYADFPNLLGLTYFLFQRVDFADEQPRSAEILDRIVRLSLSIWKLIRGAEPRATGGFKVQESGNGWLFRAINHSAGVIAQFWLEYCLSQPTGSDGGNSTFPQWMKDPLEDMVAGQDLASQIGRVILGWKLSDVYQLDPVWVRERLFQKLQFSAVGEEAFLMWEAHAGYGNLTRELISVMPRLYREAFAHFHDVGADLQTGFFRHVAIMVCSCQFDVNEGGWFRDFLLCLTDTQKCDWARQVEWVLQRVPESAKAQAWNRWISPYWMDRLLGSPCPLLPEEAWEMLQWVFVVGEAFPEAVALLSQGPAIPQRGNVISSVIQPLKEHDVSDKHPEAVLKLLDWLLQDHHPQWIDKTDIEGAIFRISKRRAFLPQVKSICNHLASSGYTGSTELWRRAETMFTED